MNPVVEIASAPLPNRTGPARPDGCPPVRVRRTVRNVVRTVLLGLGHRILSVDDPVGVAGLPDPLLFAINHSQRLEALLVPSWLIATRGFRPVHFLQDWNFQLIPGLAWILRLNDPILVDRKPARPAWLNRFRPRITDPRPAMEQARIRLAAGASVGVFPEGTINRRPDVLLRGLTGTARLSVATGVPILPIGLRFPRHRGTGPISDLEPFSIHVGRPLNPPSDPGPDATTAVHHRLMSELARLSGRSWSPDHPRTHRHERTQPPVRRPD